MSAASGAGEAALISLLRQVPLFAGLEDEPLRLLARACRRRTFAPRTTLFHQDDPGHTLYVIVSGHVLIQYVTGEGETVHIARREAGEHIGELSLLDGKPRAADAVTGAIACDLVMLDRDPFLRLMEQTPAIALNVCVSLADRLREATEETAARQKQDVMGRLAAFLLEYATTQGDAATDGSGDPSRLRLDITRQEIAAQIGAQRETVSRALSRMKAAGAVREEPGQAGGPETLILNRAKLARYARV